MLQHPTDPDIWEVVGNTHFIDNICHIDTLDYEGWKATVTYLYAEKNNIRRIII